MRIERRLPPRLIRRVAAGLAVLLAACAAPPAVVAEGGLREIEVQTFPAPPLEMPAEAKLELLKVIELRAADPGFGGLSALEVSADGSRLVALGDRGDWLSAEILREDGDIAGLTKARMGWLLRDGARPAHVMRDAEGLAIPDPDLSGPAYVGLERVHRVERFTPRDDGGYDVPGGDAPYAQPAPWGEISPNSGPEALAWSPDGRVLAVLETPRRDPDRYDAWWFSGEGADLSSVPFALPRLLDMSATGADFAPDGALWLLTRDFGLLSGFRFGISRYVFGPDGEIRGEVFLDLPWQEGADNAEGIAAWRDADGRTRLLVISDDNMNMLQKTLLYEFRAPEGY